MADGEWEGYVFGHFVGVLMMRMTILPPARDKGLLPPPLQEKRREVLIRGRRKVRLRKSH